MSKITFVCPSYNHEEYVLDFLDSLLTQTCPDWELIIIDDCSQDKTADKIKSIKDRRIHFIQNQYNKGINATLNKGISLADSELISMMASDDKLYPEYVQTVLETFKKNPDISVCYTPLTLINQKGKILNRTMPSPVGKTQEQIFAEMFLRENILWSPGMIFKKSAIMPFLPLDTGLIQYSDWYLQFLLIFNYKIKLLKKPLVYYRVSYKTISYVATVSNIRKEIETKKLMDTVLNLIGNNKDIFIKYFGDYNLIKENKINSQTIPFWLGRLALTSSNNFKQKWGLQTIMNFISTQENIDLLNKLYGFSYKDYIKYSSMISPNFKEQFRALVKGIIKKYLKIFRDLFN